MEYAFLAMMGWCGTRWPGWWREPRPPQPDPWRWLVGITGALGGIAAGILFLPIIGDAGFFATALTAFAGGVFVGSVVEGIGNRTAKD